MSVDDVIDGVLFLLAAAGMAMAYELLLHLSREMKKNRDMDSDLLDEELQRELDEAYDNNGVRRTVLPTPEN